MANGKPELVWRLSWIILVVAMSMSAVMAGMVLLRSKEAGWLLQNAGVVATAGVLLRGGRTLWKILKEHQLMRSDHDDQDRAPKLEAPTEHWRRWIDHITLFAPGDTREAIRSDLREHRDKLLRNGLPERDIWFAIAREGGWLFLGWLARIGWRVIKWAGVLAAAEWVKETAKHIIR